MKGFAMLKIGSVGWIERTVSAAPWTSAALWLLRRAPRGRPTPFGEGARRRNVTT